MPASVDVSYQFRDGQKIAPDGSAATADKVQEFISSNGYTRYYTTLWTDGVVTCDCPGWTMKKRGKPRDCKHCREVVKTDYRSMVSIDQFNVSATVPEVKRPELVARQQQHRRVAALRLSSIC